MNKSKIVISISCLYLVGVHLLLFFLYFEKVHFDNLSPNYLEITYELEGELFAESDRIEMYYGYDCNNCVSTLKYQSIQIDIDSAVLVEVYESYKNVIWVSETKGIFWGRKANDGFTRAYEFEIRGDCSDYINDFRIPFDEKDLPEDLEECILKNPDLDLKLDRRGITLFLAEWY